MQALILVLTPLALWLFYPTQGHSRIIFEPYYSVASTKSITSKSSNGTETEKISNREEKGIRAGLQFGSFFKIALSVGQSFHVTTTSENEIKDEYEELDFSADLDTSSIGKQKKKKETQNRARFSFILDPSFSIFVLRTKVGVTANQRIVKLFVDDVEVSTDEPDPTYKPHAGVGFGVRISPSMYFLAEYGFYFYQFPETEPFEKSLSLSYGIKI